ncbi:MAG: helix-turn-helix transcriptional regulator [Oscillospiraceae bacterium]|nr:helix-turn-helix transcriptional regulator [Oscillospiraceae bacterium]
MHTIQHKLLADLDQTGFGIKYETRLSAYTPPHWHQAIELLLFVRGTVTCKFEHSTLRAKAGDLYLINSHEIHETRCSADAVYLCVHILPSRMMLYVPDFDQLQFSLAFDPADSAKASAFAQLRIHMEEILRQTRDNEQASRLEQQARLFAATAILVKYFSNAMPLEERNLRRSDMQRLEPLLEQIQHNHPEDLTLDWACGEMGLNREYFCRLFKKNMGVSFVQYLYQVRATAVCRDLELSDDPISQIAERHGFRDPKMLGQYFKEIYGCTPSEKRKFFREVTAQSREEQ